MTSYTKKDFPVSNIRRFLEPGPIVLVSSAWIGSGKHHDHELAHGDGVRALAHWLLHLERKPQLPPGRRGTTGDASLIKEYYANFECRFADSSLIDKYSLFVLEVVKAHVASSPKFPRTLHYRGDGPFMLSGPTTGKFRKYFKPEML